MARIPDAEIERLKRDVSLERLVVAKGVELKKHGSNLLGRCPFHDDHTPSLVVTPETNLWHCMGACQAGGSVIDWIMKSEGLSFRHAVELLRKDIPSLAAFSGKKTGQQKAPVPVKSTTVKLPAVLEPNVEDDVLLQQVVDYYGATLKESPEALSYLESRGLKSAEMIDTFKLGFANRSLGYRLPEKNRKLGAEQRGRLQRLGVLRETGHEHFNGSIVVPIFDERGQVSEMYGRKITPGLKAGTPLHLYLPGPHRGVFNLPALTSSKEIILCEALLDALTFWCAGFRNVTSSFGVEGFTDDHREAFRKYGVESVKIAYDRDCAGDSAAAKLGAELNEMGIETYRVLFPRNMDANEYAAKMQPAAKALDLVLRHAEWMGRGRKPTVDVPANVEPELAPVMNQSEGVRTEPLSIEVAPASNIDPSLAAASSASSAPLPATSTPPKSDEVVLHFGPRRWRVRGLSKNLSAAQLKVNVLVSGDDGLFFVDTLELYAARQRGAFTKQAAVELGVDEAIIRGDLGRVLVELERLQETKIEEALKPKDLAPSMSDAERDEALELLRDPRLLDRVAADIGRCGVVGEEDNKMMAYLAATSRKLEAPLAIVIQSTSAAGKSSLMDGVLEMMPDEEVVQFSALTGQALFYMGADELKHKVLGIVEERGAERASYALKLLQSEGVLKIASTGKDPVTGKLVTATYKVEGPVMIMLTTTAIEVDEELLNRCIVLTVDEGRAQTRAIHDRQRMAQTLEGLLARQEREQIRRRHRNAQRLLRPLLVVNPFAPELKFASHVTRTRRDHAKYLTLIRSVTLLFQHQRPVRRAEHAGKIVEYIETTKGDIELADRLAHGVLGRALDELPPQTRRLLGLVEEMVSAQAKAMNISPSTVRFTRRELRQHTSWGYTQVQVHLRRLEELECVVLHRGGRGQTMEYELVHGGGEPASIYEYDPNLSGLDGHLSGSNRGGVGPKSGGYRGTQSDAIEPKTSSNVTSHVNGVGNARYGREHAAAVVAE
jgi:DNA primase